MRILLTAVTFPRPNNRLTGPWALLQAQLLRAAGHDVRVIVFHSWVPAVVARSPGAKRWVKCPREFDFDGVKVFYDRVPYYYTGRMRRWTERHAALSMRLAWPWLGRRLVKHVDEFKPDVIFAHHASVTGLAALFLQRRRRVPFVTVDHDNEEIDHTIAIESKRKPTAAVWRSAGASIGITRRMAELIKEVEPAANVVYVPHGFDIDVAPPPAAGPDVPLVVVSLGGFFERKNMPTLVRAFARVAPKHPWAVLRIGGTGADFEKVKAQVAQLGMVDRIALLGPLDHPAAMAELSRGDVFALVGWNEPYGVVYVEAMAHGLPIVCGDDAGICDVFENGVQGFAVPPRDINAVAGALDVLLSDPVRRRQIGAAGRKLYERELTGTRWAARMTELFEHAVRMETLK